MSDAIMLVGTKKGLFVGRSDDDRREWVWDEQRFLNDAVYSVCIDTRADPPRLFAGATSEHYGPQVFRSDDLGRTWQETPNGAIRFPEDTERTLERIWQLQPAGPSEPDVVYAGTQPSALFRSEDRGKSFEMVRPLWDHPHRPEWGEGYGGQAIHTIVPNMQDSTKMLVAMSTGGVYRTSDSGKTWAPANAGIPAGFMPDPYPEFGQCVHKVAQHPEHPERAYAQNHGGVLRTDDGGDSWQSIADGLPSDFGFPVVVHPGRPDTVYVFPLTADWGRSPIGHQAQVWRSDDAGVSWRALDKGLPDQCYAAVMRDAMTTDTADPLGVYFGGRDGSVYASVDEGETWSTLATHFPDVLSVRAAVIS